jgi:hypothetical protein
MLIQQHEVIMNNDLTGTQGSSRIVPPIPTPDDHLPTLEIITSKVMPFDSQIYDGADSMNNDFILQQFKVNQNKMYDTSAEFPLLLQPDPEGEIGPQPAGTAEQKLIMRFFYKRVRELLGKSGLSAEQVKEVYNALASGTPIGNSQLATLAKNVKEQAKKETQEQARLPESWDPQSTSAKDWIPKPIEPYRPDEQQEINQFYDKALLEALSEHISQATPPLTEEQKNQLQNAISKGKVSSGIAEVFNAITEKARQATQKTYGLAETWFKGTTNIDEWKPINLGIISPQAVNNSRAEVILTNINEFLADLEKAGEKVVDHLDPSNPKNLTMDEFRRVISKAIQDLKKTLRDIQLQDTEKSKERLQEKLDAVQAKTDAKIRADEKQKEIDEKNKKAEKVSTAMKICGPMIAALGTIVGALLLIFTFGASTSLIVASIAVGVAMTTYSIVDSVTGCTTSLINFINEALATAHPENEALQKFLKALIVTAVVAVLAVVIILSGGSASANIATNVAAKTALEVAKQLSAQLMIIAIMSSNAIPELIGSILRASGVSKEDSRVWEIVMMVITMITVMSAMAIGKGGGLGATAKSVAEGVKSAARSVQEAAVNAMKFLVKLMDEIKNGVIEATQATIKTLLKMLEQLSKSLNALVKFAKEVPGNILASVQRVKEAIQDLRILLKDHIKDLQTLVGNVAKREELITMIKDPVQRAQLLRDIKDNAKLLTLISEHEQFDAQQLDLIRKTVENAIRREELVLNLVNNLKAAGESLKNSVQQLMDDISRVAVNAKDAAIRGKDVVLEELQAAINKLQTLLNSAFTSLRNNANIGQQLDEILEGFKSIGKGFKSIPEVIKEAIQLRALKQAGNVSDEMIKALESSKIEHARISLQSTSKVLQLTPLVINVADGINRGVMALQVRRLLQEVGDIKASQELFQGIIALLEKLLTVIQTGINERSEFIIYLQRAFKDFYDGLSRNAAKIFQAIQG